MKAEILARYADRPLPRYTSYPTAPHFTALGAGDYRDWLAQVPGGSDACYTCTCHSAARCAGIAVVTPP
jgi:hypothetical protein